MLVFLHLPAFADDDIQVTVESAGWELVGDLRLPESSDELPAVLLLNQAAGDRRDYRYLAEVEEGSHPCESIFAVTGKAQTSVDSCPLRPMSKSGRQ
jgi:hypothetical protein